MCVKWFSRFAVTMAGCLLLGLPCAALAQTASEYYEQGKAAAQQGRDPDAIVLLTKAIEKDQTLAPAFRERGLARERLRDDKGALADFDRVVALVPDDADAFVHRALNKVRLRDARGALADANRSISLDPASANGHYVRAYAEATLGDHGAAIADYTITLMLNPTAGGVHNNRAVERREAGDYTGAIADFRRAIEINPADSLARQNLTALQLKLGGGAPPPLPPTPSADREVGLPPPPPLPPPLPPAAPCSMTGEWSVVETDGVTTTLSLRQDGSTVTGTYAIRFVAGGVPESAPVSGTVSGRNLRLTVPSGTDQATFVGTVAEDCRTLSATMSLAGQTLTQTFRRR